MSYSNLLKSKNIFPKVVMSKDKENKLVLVYQLILATTFVFVFFTNFDVYCSYSIETPQPKVVIFAFVIASIPLLFSLNSRIKYISKTLFYWIYGYLFISLASFVIYSNYQPAASSEELRTRALSALFMLISILIFSCPIVQKWVRYEILLITLMNVIANVYSLFSPDSFVTVFDDQSVSETSRAAGFYIDANRSTCVLVTGIVFSINLLPQKYRLPFIFVIFIGAFVTFSRSGLISFLVVISIMVLKGEILIFNKKVISQALIIGIVACFILNLIGVDWLNNNVEETVFENKNFERVTQMQFTGQKSEIDELSSSRLPIVEQIWQEFLESPIWGRGIGYGLWLESNIVGKRSHNMYLSFMLEHGFLGALVLPSLLYCCTCNAPINNKAICLAFSSLILIWAFFSHNILEHREFLMSFSLMSTINVTSKPKHKYQGGDSNFLITS
jgi:O-Antigen ligase